MRTKQFGKLLGGYAQAFGKVGACGSKERLGALSAILIAAKSEPVTAFIDRAEGLLLSATPSDTGSAASADAADDLEAVCIAAQHSTTPTTLSESKRFRKFLDDNRDMSFESLLQTLKTVSLGPPPPGQPKPLPNESFVDAYARELDDAVHDARRFRALFEALKNDPCMKKAEVLQIANRIVYKMPSKTSRTQALAQIWKRHETSEGTANKVRAIGGKSAA